MARETKCTSSPLVRAYSDYVIRGMGFQKYTHMALEKRNIAVVLNWMSRRSSVKWPERAYCDDRSHSITPLCLLHMMAIFVFGISKRIYLNLISYGRHFVCSEWGHLGDRKIGRVVKNDKEVVAMLRGLESEKFEGDRVLVFVEADYNLLPFEDQIRLDVQVSQSVL